MRNLKRIILFMAAFGLLPSTAYAVDDVKTCKIYGKIGGAITDFMLPLTMQDLVNILTGKDPKLATEMTSVIIYALDKAEYVVMGDIGEEKAGLMGEAAGQVAIELLMSGRASSGAEIVTIMEDTCLSVGFDAIVDNQRDARASLSKNMGQ